MENKKEQIDFVDDITEEDLDEIIDAMKDLSDEEILKIIDLASKDVFGE